jgi:hypothetical protein
MQREKSLGWDFLSVDSSKHSTTVAKPIHIVWQSRYCCFMYQSNKALHCVLVGCEQYRLYMHVTTWTNDTALWISLVIFDVNIVEINLFQNPSRRRCNVSSRNLTVVKNTVSVIPCCAEWIFTIWLYNTNIYRKLTLQIISVWVLSIRKLRFYPVFSSSSCTLSALLEKDLIPNHQKYSLQ